MEKGATNEGATTERRSACRLQVRYLMSFMISMGLFLVYSMRVNLSVTIIAMVNSTAVMNRNTSRVTNSSCPAPLQNTSSSSDNDESSAGEFLWDPVMQANVLNAFFYGYIVTQIPAGWLSEVVSPTWIFAAGIGLTSLLTLATEVVAKANFAAFLALRVLEGIAEGVTFPSMYALMARWSPTQERTFLLTICGVGTLLGTIVTLPASALLCQYGFAGGWPSVFYLTGLSGCVWFLIWIFIASDTPEKHKFISHEERKYIVESRNAKFAIRKRVPWAGILTSRAVWMCALIKFCSAWSFYTLLTELPSYLANILHFNIQKNGVLNAGVYVSQAIVGLCSSRIADYLRAKEILRVTNVRKLFETIGAVMGLTNCISNSAGIFTPLVVGYLTENDESIAQWNKAFFAAAGLCVLGAVAFLLLGTAEVQPWACPAPVGSINDSCSLLVPADEEAEVSCPTDSQSAEKT